MPIDPNIALAVKTPEPISPLQTIGGLMQIRGQIADIALRNAQTQAQQQQAADVAQQMEQRQRQNQSFNRIQELMRDPNVQQRTASGDFSDIYKNGIDPTVANQVIKNIQDQRTTAQSLQKEKLANYITQRGLLKDMLEGVNSEKDDATAAAQYNSGRENLMQSAPDLAKNLPVLQPGTNFRDQLNSLINTNGFHQALLEDAATVASKQSEAAKNTAQAGQATAETAKVAAQTPGAIAESTKAQLITQAMQNAQQAIKSGQHPVDAILGSIDPTAAAAYKPAYDSAMANGGPEAAKAILEAAANHAGEVANKTNPNIINAEVGKAKQIAQVTAPIEIGKAIATAKALRMGDNPAVAGVPPAAVAKVQSDAIKLDQDYIAAKTVTDSMGRLLDLAEHGNKAAGSNVPLVGVETLNAINGIKRINTAEIDQYGTAGSLLDQIKGKLGKLAVGQPIPQDVLNDIRELHQSLGTQAYQKYTTNLDSLNQRTGAKFAPTVEAPNISKGATYSQTATGPGGHRIGSNDGGQTWFDLQTGRKIQ